MTEKTLETKIRQYIEQKGGISWKWVSPGRAGVPDRIIVLPGGVIVFVEVKKPGVKDGLSPQQKKVFRILTGLGCRVWRISDFEEFKDAVSSL